jgi:hypothetical protein
MRVVDPTGLRPAPRAEPAGSPPRDSLTLVVAMLLVAVPLAAGCGKKAKQGLPPAESWDQASGPGALASLDDMQRPRSTGESSSNPHAGVPGAPPLDDDGDMGGMAGMAGMAGGNPHAGVPGAPPLDDDTGGGMGDNPHAGMDMGGGGGNPHAGMDMGGGGGNPHAGGGIDVTQLGIAPPDPARKIDPSRRVRGTIRLAPKVKDRVKANGAVFLVIRRAGTDGQPTGSPLAVEKLSWSGDALPFELTEANAMAGGTELAGDVVVMARFDQDSDALSKQPGDVTGQVRAKVPADKLELTLDTILP